jgi:hypothetical protein
LVSPTAKTVSLSKVKARQSLPWNVPIHAKQRPKQTPQERSLPSGFVDGVWALVEVYHEGSTMTLQERIDYLTSISETIVGQLNELITLTEQIQKAQAASAIQHLAPKKARQH